MRSWQMLSAFVVLIGWPHGVEAQPSTEPAPLVIPETAPKRPPNDPPGMICGTGLISPAEYQEWWSYWRAVALSAQGPTQRECRGFALSQLAQLTERRGLSHLGAPYRRAALETLERVLAGGDPRLASLRLNLATGGGVSPRESERLIRSSIRALEAAVAHPRELPAIGCAFLLESPDVRIQPYPVHLSARTAADQRRLLSQAQLELLAVLVVAERSTDALAVARTTRQHLERRLELDGVRDGYHRLEYEASRLVDLLERLPSAQLPEQQLVEAVDLLRRAAPDRRLDQTQGLRSLAKYYEERRELDRAEKALRLSLEHDYAAMGEKRKDAGRITALDNFRPAAIHGLVEIYELQRRWTDLETLYLEDLSEAVKVNAESASRSLHRLVSFYRRHGQYEEALKHLRHLDRILPERWFTHEQFAGIYVELGRFPEAETELREAFRLLSRTADRDGAGRTSLLETLAGVQRRMGQLAAAEASLAEAVEIYETKLARRKPGISLWVVRCSKARLLVELGRFDEAETLYREAEAELASKPASHRLDLTMPLLGRMRIATARGDAKRAAALLEESVKVCSDGSEAGSARLERCLAEAAERAAEAGLDGPAADLRRRADEVTAWAREPERETLQATLVSTSKGTPP